MIRTHLPWLCLGTHEQECEPLCNFAVSVYRTHPGGNHYILAITGHHWPPLFIASYTGTTRSRAASQLTLPSSPCQKVWDTQQSSHLNVPCLPEKRMKRSEQSEQEPVADSSRVADKMFIASANPITSHPSISGMLTLFGGPPNHPNHPQHSKAFQKCSALKSSVGWKWARNSWRLLWLEVCAAAGIPNQTNPPPVNPLVWCKLPEQLQYLINSQPLVAKARTVSCGYVTLISQNHRCSF